MTVAVIDIGTNTILLLIAERVHSGLLVPLLERATITRLGAGVDRTRALSPEGIYRTRQCLGAYARLALAASPKQIAVVGTSAMRDADNGAEVWTLVKSLFGVDLRVLTGEDEARLTFRGALSGLGWQPGVGAAVFDIGGGSTEVALGRAGGASASAITLARSFNLGSVRLTERFLASDPPTVAELSALLETTRSAFQELPPISASQPPVGVAGTITTLAAVALGLENYDGTRVHGEMLRTEDLRRTVNTLANQRVALRRSVHGMQPERADVIVAGGCIALSLLDHWTADKVVVSDRGVRWGLAEEMTL